MVEKLLLNKKEAAVFLQRKMLILISCIFLDKDMEGNRDTGRKQGR
jgi:hypothetical protein